MSDTIDAELNVILKDYRQVLTQQMGLILSGRHRLDIKIADNVLLDEAKAKLQALLLRERKAELERLFDANNGVMGSHYIYLTDDAADEIAKALRNRIAELSRLSGVKTKES